LAHARPRCGKTGAKPARPRAQDESWAKQFWITCWAGLRRHDLVASSDPDDLQSIASATGQLLEIDHP
jgi:hypothetical protein